MAARGLVTRTRDPVNRRIQVVELTEAGEAAFLRLQQAAIEFDTRLRAGLADADLDHLGDLLGQLAANVGSTSDGSIADGSTADGSTADGGPPWADLAESRRQQLSAARACRGLTGAR
jgi:MarR family transcriptional regulator, transcriptional regulator for hemolysin